MGNDLLGLQSTADWLLMKIGVFPSLKLQPQENGITRISDGKDQIAIANPDRAIRYRHGIKRRCRQITRKRYLAGGRVSITPGDVVLNVGANIGEVSCYLADCGAEVLAIEPDPKARQCLEANAINRSIEIIPYGVWNQNGTLSFYLATASADSSLVNPSDEKIEIDVKTIDTIVEEHKLERIRLIAGDAEGAEPEVLQGAVEALKITDFVSLDVSYERRGEATREACSEILRTAGFDIIKAKSKKHLVARRRT